MKLLPETRERVAKVFGGDADTVPILAQINEHVVTLCGGDMRGIENLKKMPHCDRRDPAFRTTAHRRPAPGVLPTTRDGTLRIVHGALSDHVTSHLSAIPASRAPAIRTVSPEFQDTHHRQPPPLPAPTLPHHKALPPETGKAYNPHSVSASGSVQPVFPGGPAAASVDLSRAGPAG